MKSLFQFAHEKRPPLAVRFDANPPSLQTVAHTVCAGGAAASVALRLLSLPLSAVEALPRLIDRLRTPSPPAP